MVLKVNGKPRDVPEGITLPDYLKLLGVDNRPLVVQHNDSILRREQFHTAALKEGDVLEIVHMVGGG